MPTETDPTTPAQSPPHRPISGSCVPSLAPFGYQTDAENGLQLLGHRYYDSSTGRFLSRDPIKDGRNWYSYCGNNSVTGADPSGLIDLTGPIGDAMRRGIIPKGSDKIYKRDKNVRDRLHKEVGKRKRGINPKKRNDDNAISKGEYDDAFDKEFNEQFAHGPSFDPKPIDLLKERYDIKKGMIPALDPEPLSLMDWLKVGAVIVGAGVVIVASGGSLTPAAGTAAVILIGVVGLKEGQ